MSYLKTLRRIPADIMLAIFAQDFDEGNGDRCICGWAIREQLARVAGTTPEAQDAYDMTNDGAWRPFERCANTFGGSREEWSDLYYGASDDGCDVRARVEEAVVDRLNEIVL